MSCGISIYFGLDNTMEENIKLLKDAYKLGFTRIFTSLHIPEANYNILKKEVEEFFNLAKNFDMDIISDISPNTFKFLGIKDMDLSAIKDLGIKTIRIDFGYKEAEIAKISHNPYNIKIQLNASTITEDFLNELDKYNPNYKNIDALHNFYPRRGTGISKECLLEKNIMLTKRGIKIGAFIQSNNRKRSPLKDGLPTLEDHRNKPVYFAANGLFAMGVDSVFIGDALPSYKELKDLASLKSDEVMLRIIPKTKNNISLALLKNRYTSRTDEARDAIRATESRILIKDEKIYPENTIDRKYGDITIDNIDYGRYMGELQILINDLEKDNRVNVVASVVKDDYFLLNYIKGGKHFSFKLLEIGD
ncbi:DUF871 domain-containing protein [Clostridium fallax]|uniref:Outer surface protein n=1 Tax=Clostridium fallax TaxID=1533 RepID=A0A1M4T029_9CLOT|nr:MupG family TIM beta-alpha barrel fold protein [Clostridium fallax]SHE37809.1 hypothetical protein SAMN05443638_101263 [Clostridium fallax]SQB08058.1 outer surface protein [Clostridium fallax]